jgi:hypothetical protein
MRETITHIKGNISLVVREADEEGELFYAATDESLEGTLINFEQFYQCSKCLKIVANKMHDC